MSVIAGLQDFRQEGPPADVGTFEFPGDILVFTHTFAGTTYACAIRSGERGWVLVDYGTVNTTVIQSGLAALTAGRFWDELVIVKGTYTLTERIDVPSYAIFDISMAHFTFPNNATPTPVDRAGTDYYTMITNSDHAGGNISITIIGGYIDGNGDNQNINLSWALVWFCNVTEGKMLRMHVEDSCYGINHGAGHRAYCYFVNDSDGVIMDHCYGSHSGYEVVGIRYGNNRIFVEGCRLDDGVAHVLQVVGSVTPNDNIIIGPGNHITQLSANATNMCLTIHNGQHVFIHHNTITTGANNMQHSIKVIGTSTDITIETNKISHYGNEFTAAISLGEMENDVITHVHILNNEIKVGNIQNVMGIMLSGVQVDRSITISDIDIIDNDVVTEGNWAAPIFLSYCTLTEIRIALNRLENTNVANAARGISGTTTITDSEIVGNYVNVYSSGIRIEDAVGVLFARNEFSVNCAWGVMTRNTSDYNLIVENNVRNIAAFAQRIDCIGYHDITRNNIGFNPIGNIATPFHNAATHSFGQFQGTAAGPTVANQDYMCEGADVIVDITAGTGVDVTLKDPAGNVISALGAVPIHALWVPAHFIINFGNFTVAPTVVVSGN